MNSNSFNKNGYQLFKYTVYLSVFTNVFLFLQKDIAASAHRFGGDFSIVQIFEAYTNTVDTASWVILLILFELETYIIPKDKIVGWVSLLFRGLTVACVFVIFSSFLGYIEGFRWLKSYEKAPINDLCEVVGQSWMIELDEFKTIEQNSCKDLAKGKTFFLHQEKAVYTDNYFLKETNWLAGIDVANSLSWLLIVLLLEIDLLLGRDRKQWAILKKLSFVLKNLLYLVLLFCAVYWGIYGDFLEFWDAFLWIVAFVFIELNLLKWGK